MGVWALEFDPGMTGEVYEMAEFNGDLFAFVYNGTGGGVWRRTPPNWTRTLSYGNSGRACVWDGRMWAGGTSIPWYIYVSDDGVTWTVDHDFTCGGPYSHWSALGGYGSYLYAYQYAMCGVTTAFYRRDTDGNWTQYPPDSGNTWGHGEDVIGYGGNVYFTHGTRVHYYIGYWATEPTLDWEGVHFTVLNGILYAYGSQTEAWRKVGTGGWTKELNVGGAWGAGGAVSVGDDGNLWAAAEDGADSRVYVRSGTWFLHSTAAGVSFNSAIAHDGAAYAGTDSCEFWRYTPTFDLTPAGGGLYPGALDCDSDGNFLYIAAYDPGTGNPVLVRAQLPLVQADMGVGAFAPGAGTAINVKATAVGGKLAVAGRFSAGGNDSVQVSEDFGITWTDIAPNWGDTAQPLLVDPDTLDEVMVALDANQDLLETFDGGATPWLTRNAAVGYSPGAMARLPEGDELVVGDDGANVIQYSPNRGQRLHNITGAFQGNCQALEVI